MEEVINVCNNHKFMSISLPFQDLTKTVKILEMIRSVRNPESSLKIFRIISTKKLTDRQLSKMKGVFQTIES